MQPLIFFGVSFSTMASKNTFTSNVLALFVGCLADVYFERQLEQLLPESAGGLLYVRIE